MSGAPGPDRYAVVGHPVGHSRSPFIHGEYARATGQAMLYGRLDVAPAAFDAAVRAFFADGGRGLNVTGNGRMARSRATIPTAWDWSRI